MESEKTKMKSKRKMPISDTRKRYCLRLVGRCIVLVVCIFLAISYSEIYDILDGMNFFAKLSPFHLLWFIWVVDMFLQIVPVKNKVALGSQKLFATHFRPIREKINYEALRDYVISTTKSAYKVFIIWVILIGVIGILYYNNIINQVGIFLITVFFYVCDLICVLIWCPFRLIMGNKCCTTCRIFNWDHLMMFSPLIFVQGFFSVSLVLLAFAAWLVWELCVMLYPERFCEKTNVALKCSECTDKLCTQYCQKLR